MSQVFRADGQVYGDAAEGRAVRGGAAKTPTSDGYDAVQLGWWNLPRQRARPSRGRAFEEAARTDESTCAKSKCGRATTI